MKEKVKKFVMNIKHCFDHMPFFCKLMLIMVVALAFMPFIMNNPLVIDSFINSLSKDEIMRLDSKSMAVGMTVFICCFIYVAMALEAIKLFIENLINLCIMLIRKMKNREKKNQHITKAKC